MIYEYEINGVCLRTGDLVCTTDWGAPVLPGEFWRFIGKLIPADVNHIAVYVGPAGRCVEAGARGRVITYTVENGSWDSARMRPERGEMQDAFYGAVYPLEGRGLSEKEETKIRENVACYCLAQSELGKPYNLNFYNSKTEEMFYCSHLAYMAYLKNGINLYADREAHSYRETERIIFPHELWNRSVNRKCPGLTGEAVHQVPE